MALQAVHDKTAYVLSLHGFCNNRCSLCVCGDRRSQAPRTRESIIQEAASARERFHGFILSDGEPTLLQDLPQIIADLKQLDPEILQIHTNARMFAYKQYLRELLSIKGVDYLIKCSGADAAVHDKLTRVDGSWAQTMRGIAGLSASERSGIGFHIALPITSETLPQLDTSIELLAAMNPDTIILTGGYPACGESAPCRSETVDDRLLSLWSRRGSCRLVSQYLSGDKVLSSYNHKVEVSPSGRYFVGADTNNPWVLRHAGPHAGRSLIVYMPYHETIDKHVIVAAPASLGILKAFAGSLGYSCDLVDLEARNQRTGVDIGRHYAKRVFFETGDSYGALHDTERLEGYLADFERLLPARDLDGYDVIAASMIDSLSFSSGAAGLRYIRSKRKDAILAAGIMENADVRHFMEHADHCFEFMKFGGYSYCAMMNMLEFGDRAPAALRNRHGGFPDSKRIEVNDDMAFNPEYDHASREKALYFRDPSADLIAFAREQQLPVNATPTGFSMFFFSRGCRWKCAMCNPGGFTTPADPETSARRLLDIRESEGFDSFLILDHAINNDEAGMKVFCEAIIRSGKKIYWTSCARPSFKNPETLRIMREAGCVTLIFGVETGSQRILSLLNKGFTVKAASRALQDAATAGIWVQIDLISGFVTENESDVDATIRFLQDHAGCIDAICYHSSFLWRKDVRMRPEEFNMRFVPGSINHICGVSRLYEEIDGKSCEEILAGKQKAYARIEEARAGWHVVSALLTPYDIFQFYRSGYDRKTVHRYAAFLKNKYRDHLQEMVEKSSLIRLRNEMWQALTNDFEAHLPVIIPLGTGAEAIRKPR